MPFKTSTVDCRIFLWHIAQMRNAPTQIMIANSRLLKQLIQFTSLIFNAKSTKNSPTDAFAYFAPSNVRPPKRRVLGGCANIHKTGALSLGAEQEQPTACVPGAGGWQRRPQARADSVLFAEPPQPLRRVFLRRKGLILLRPLNAGRRRLPRKATCGWFWRF